MNPAVGPTRLLKARWPEWDGDDQNYVYMEKSFITNNQSHFQSPEIIQRGFAPRFGPYLAHTVNRPTYSVEWCPWGGLLLFAISGPRGPKVEWICFFHIHHLPNCPQLFWDIRDTFAFLQTAILSGIHKNTWSGPNAYALGNDRLSNNAQQISVMSDWGICES